MSGIPKSRKLWITPLSPVHMGTDEDYTPTGYVIEGNALYEFDERALENLPETERQSLNKLLNGQADQNMLKQVQAFFHKNREWLIPAAVNIVHVSEELAKLYAARIGKAANRESGGREVQNRLEIERAAYNPLDRRLMLPGSGLKGAIRTALLDEVNSGKKLKEVTYFDHRDRREKNRKENNKKLQKRLFKGDFSTDPMRLVQVGDCAWHGPEQLNSAEVLFAVNRKKHTVTRNGQEVTSQAEQRHLYQMLECATPFRFRAFQGLLTVPELSDQQESHKLPAMKFGFSEIAAACNRFYRPIFDAETGMLKSRGFLDDHWRNTVQQLFDDPAIRQRLDDNQVFLLRVGRHSGAESVTLNGVRSIKIMQGKGQQPKWESEAKTVWLSSGCPQYKRYLRPFGWLLVEMTAMDEEPPSWSVAENIMNTHNQQMSQWLDKVKSYQTELKIKIFAAREQAEIDAREAEQRKADREAKLAAMSPLELEVVEICEKEKNNNPAMVLYNLLEDGKWEDRSDQRFVAAKIREIWETDKENKKWNPDFSGKNKQKIKQKARCCKVLKYLDDD